jgi:hypothetical protein
MADLAKSFQMAHRSRTALGKTVIPSVTPREAKNPQPNNGVNLYSYSWEGSNPGGYGFLGSPPPGVTAAGYTKDYGNYRGDLQLMSFDGSLDGGWTLVHRGKSKSQNYDQVYAYRSLRTEMFTFVDDGDSTWRCSSGGHVASTIIPVGGVSAKKGPGGLDEITIKSHSPNVIFGPFSLPQMPYILAKVANDERFAQYFLTKWGYLPWGPVPNPPPKTLEDYRISVQKQLGYLLQGQGQGGMADKIYKDPLMGFANHNRDDYTMTVGKLMEEIPANDFHVVNNLSVSRALAEVTTNHFLINGKPMGNTFPLNIATNLDPENDLMHYEASGSLNSMAQEATQHGCWLSYWDSKSGFHFVPDTCSLPLAQIPIAATVSDGPGLIGEIDVTLGTPSIRVSRAGVKGQEFLGFGDTTGGVVNDYFNRRIGRTWPVDTPPGRPGVEVTMDGYMGKQMLEQARRLWAKANRQTTLAWNNIPYPDLLFGLLGQVVAFKVKDPKGGFDFSLEDKSFPYPGLTYRGGKLFQCVQVSGSFQQGSRNGNSFLGSAQFLEVIARP